MNNLPEFDPIEYAKVSAHSVWECRNRRESIDDAVGNAFDNLRDTFADYGVKNQFIIEEAEATFWHECRVRGYVRPEYR